MNTASFRVVPLDAVFFNRSDPCNHNDCHSQPLQMSPHRKVDDIQLGVHPPIGDVASQHAVRPTRNSVQPEQTASFSR